MVDSGIAANLLELDADALRQPAGHLGALLEGFVAMELSRQLTWGLLTRVRPANGNPPGISGTR